MRTYTHIPRSGLMFLATLQILGVAQASSGYQVDGHPAGWGQRQAEQPALAPDNYYPPPAEHQQPAYSGPPAYRQDNSPSVVTVLQTGQVQTKNFTETLQLTDVSTGVMHVTETQPVAKTQTEHVTVHSTVVENLPPVHLTVTRSASEETPTSVVSLATETFVRTMVVTSVVPNTVIAQMAPVTNTAATQIYTATATEAATEAAAAMDLGLMKETPKLTETAVVTDVKTQTEVQVSHATQAQVSTQVQISEKTKTTTEVIHIVKTRTATQAIHSAANLTAETSVVGSVVTGTAAQVIHSVATKTQVASETELATETQGVVTETGLAAAETQVIHNAVTETETIHSIATETVTARVLTETDARTKTQVTETTAATATATDIQVTRSVATETQVDSTVLTETAASVATQNLAPTKTQLFAGAPHRTAHITTCTDVTTAVSCATSSPVAGGGVVHTVIVGGDAGLVYTPSEIVAEIGDIVNFVFMKQNHTVTQSTFDKPCNKMSVDAPDSGFLTNINNTVVPAPSWNYTVVSKDPTWWYCKQRTGTHCGKGMVFAINPTCEKTFKSFQDDAIALNGTAAATSTAVSSPPSAVKTSTTTSATHTIVIGGDAGLIYSPSEVVAAVGDVVHFVFMKQNHTVTQSTFDKPCNKVSAGAPDSGFLTNVNNTVVPAPTWNYTVTSTEPTWWYCKQRTGTHCGKGMVFAINPTIEKTFAKFKEVAIALNGTITSTNVAATSTSTSTSTAQAYTTIVTGTATLPSAGGSCDCQCFCPLGSFNYGAAPNRPALPAAPLLSLVSTFVTMTKSGWVSAIQPTPVLMASPVLSSSAQTAAAATTKPSVSSAAQVLDTTNPTTAVITKVINTESATVSKTTGTTTDTTAPITSTAKTTYTARTTPATTQVIPTKTRATTATQVVRVTTGLASSLKLTVPPAGGAATTNAATGTTKFIPINTITMDMTNLQTEWTGKIMQTSP